MFLIKTEQLKIHGFQFCSSSLTLLYVFKNFEDLSQLNVSVHIVQPGKITINLPNNQTTYLRKIPGLIMFKSILDFF